MTTRRCASRFVIAAAAMMLATTTASCSSIDESGTGGGGTNVTVALDYIANNASFEGFYVAQAKGYYTEAGLNVTIKGYTSTYPDVLVNAGQADFGTIDQPTLILDRAAGQPLTSVMAIMQHDPIRLAVSAKDASSVNSPKDLQNRTFGGFGVPIEKAINDTILSRAGASPQYQTVTLGSDVYNALSGGQVDWAQPYDTDDILWAKMRGTPWRTFNPRDFGVPDCYAKMVFSSEKYLHANPDTARKFIDATVRGYQWSQQHPADAVQVLAEAKVGPLIVNEQAATSQLLASDYWLDPAGKVGPELGDRWMVYTKFLFDAGLLKDADGKALTSAPPDPTAWFTNEYLPKD